MLPWMVVYDNRYGRWLSEFWAMLATLPDDQVAFLRTDFAQSITGNPYSNMAWDMWIECTMIRANFLAYLVRHPVKQHHPSPIGHGLELSAGRCRPVRHTMPALPLQLPVQTPAEESEDDAGDDGCEDEDDDAQRRICARLELDVSESSETESSDSD
jgi:hypothetical protein